MTVRIRVLVTFFCCFIYMSSIAVAQESLENMLDVEDASDSDVEYLEDLQDLLANPLNVNTADADELTRLPNVTQIIGEAIVSYRKANGPFKTKLEVKNVPGVPPDIFMAIRPFITARKIKKRDRFEAISGSVRLRLTQRDPSYSDTDSDELTALLEDNPAVYYQRTKLSWRNWLNIGFLTEKDRGESNLDDLLLWAIEIDPHDRPVKLNLGYYRLHMGQGLIFSPQAGVFKGGEIVTGIRQRTNYTKIYTSTNEVAGFYGGAVNASVGPFSGCIFYSDRKIDASPAYFYSSEYDDFVRRYPQAADILDPLITNDAGRIYFKADELSAADQTTLGETAYNELLQYAEDRTVLAIDEGGLHRTESELGKADNLSEKIFGAHGRFSFGTANSVGITWYQSEFDKQIFPKYDERAFYRFRGDELSGYGADVDLYFDRFNVFGEWAQSQDYGQAWLMGATLDLDQVELAAVWRDYDPDYFTFHGYAFADSKGHVDNEVGQFLGFRWKLPNRIKWRAYFDFFRHPFRQYLAPIPDDGREFYSELEIPLENKIKWTLRVKSKTKGDSVDGSDWLDVNKRNYRAQVDWAASKVYQLRFRYERAEAHSADLNIDQSGMILYGGLKANLFSRLQTYARLAFFDTESSLVPVYMYENDMLGVLKNSYLSGEGRRWYLMGKLAIKDKRLNLSGKIAQTTHLAPDADAINTPANTSETLTEWGLQLDVRF